MVWFISQKYINVQLNDFYILDFGSHTQKKNEKQHRQNDSHDQEQSSHSLSKIRE